MKEALIVDIDGYITDVTLVSDDVTGVFPIYRTPESEEGQEQPAEPVLIGYQVSVPVRSMLYKPRFDRASYESYGDQMADYQVAYSEWLQIPEEDRPADPPAAPTLPEFWIEGLTEAELDAIRNTPQPQSAEQRIAELEDENINLMLALTQVYEEKEADKAQLEQENIDTMLALTEIYETMLGGS